MEDKICILIPTRKRLTDFLKFAESWKKTQEGNSIVVVGIDKDDTTYDEIISTGRYPFIYERNEPKPFLHILNDLAIKYSEKYKYVAFLEDDVTFNSTNWETSFITKLKELGPAGIVWANDSMNKGALIGIPFMSSDIVKCLGFMSPPEFRSQTVDVYWTEVFTELGTLHYFDNILLEHRHYVHGKRPKDDTSHKVQADSVGEIEYYRGPEYKKNRDRDIAKLKKLCEF